MLLHELFEEKISRSGHEGVVRCDDTVLTYAELNAKANALAHLLIGHGIRAGRPVGIFLDRSVEMVIAALAILKAGGCYVPVEPGFPKERIDYILSDSQTVCVISSVKYKNFLAHDNILYIDELNLNDYPGTNPLLCVSASSLAYIIYTSGTTGKPKGTMIEHRNVVSVLTNSSRVYDFQTTDSWTCVHSICFDFSVWEIFGALMYGKELVIVPKETVKNVVTFLDLLRRGITILSLTPTAFYSLMDYLVNEEKPVEFALRYVILGGEAVSPARFKEWHRKFPAVKVINGYGVTETAIFFSFKEITKELIESNSSNIGKPIPGLKNYIRDGFMHEVAEGEVGELYIGGCAVGRGYINQPLLQAKHFVSDPFVDNGLLYRTGDQVRRLANNEMEYIGRIDNQVKIRGYRIELGEVEKNIYGYGNVKNVVVTVYKSSSDEPYLTAYIVWDENCTTVSGEDEIKEYLSGKLPEYMIPYYFVFLDEMPMTNSGKADKSKLPAPQSKATHSIKSPRTHEEVIMTGIWSDVLGIEKETIGVEASFFDLGGHSLLLTRLSAEIFYRYGIRIPIAELFSDPTVEKLAVYLKQPATVRQTVIEKDLVTEDQDAEVTLSQKILFLGNKFNPSEAFPNSGISYEVTGDIDVPGLEQAFRHVIQSNEGLRMVFTMEKGKIIRKVCTEYEFEVQRIRSFRTEIDEEIMALTRPFNFKKCPLIRVFYIESPNDRKFLYVDMPHVNSDGVSLEVIINEMAAYYNQQPDTSSKMQFSDFQKYYNAYFNSDQYHSDKEFWREQFDITVPAISFKRNSQTIPGSVTGVSRVIDFPVDISIRVNRYLRARNITKFQFLLAAYFLFVRKITGEDDVSVMIPLHNRSVKGFEQIIGLLANRSVVRMKMNNDKSILSFINECKASVLQAVNHTTYPFEMIFDEHGKGKKYRKPLYQTFFNYHNHRKDCKLGNAVLKLHIHNKAKEILPLSADVFDMGEDHVLRILSASGVFSKQELNELATIYFAMLETIVENDKAGIQSLFEVKEKLMAL